MIEGAQHKYNNNNNKENHACHGNKEHCNATGAHHTHTHTQFSQPNSLHRTQLCNRCCYDSLSFPFAIPPAWNDMAGIEMSSDPKGWWCCCCSAAERNILPPEQCRRRLPQSLHVVIPTAHGHREVKIEEEELRVKMGGNKGDTFRETREFRSWG